MDFCNFDLWIVISTISNTRQQAMLISFFFMVACFIRIMRMIMLKGSSYKDISDSFFALVINALMIIGLAIRRYRKVA